MSFKMIIFFINYDKNNHYYVYNLNVYVKINYKTDYIVQFFFYVYCRHSYNFLIINKI